MSVADESSADTSETPPDAPTAGGGDTSDGPHVAERTTIDNTVENASDTTSTPDVLPIVDEIPTCASGPPLDTHAADGSDACGETHIAEQAADDNSSLYLSSVVLLARH